MLNKIPKGWDKYLSKAIHFCFTYIVYTPPEGNNKLCTAPMLLLYAHDAASLLIVPLSPKTT